MLIFTRKSGKSIVVQEKSPKNVSIVRKELLDSATLSNQTSTGDHKKLRTIPLTLLKALRQSSREAEEK